jgi:2-methylaconitate cis-trans-isomerase PrpF
MKIPAPLVAHRTYMKMMAELRVKASQMMKLCQDEDEARLVRTSVPDLRVMSPDRNALEGIPNRYVSFDRPHRATHVMSQMALAVACRIEGTIASDILPS